MSSLGQQVYQRVAAQTSSPPEQFAFLLDRAASYVLEAKDHIEAKDIEKRFLATEKTLNVLTGLANVLDYDSEDVREFVTDLSAFLQRMIVGLVDINAKNDPSLCDNMAGALKEMARIWRQAARAAI